MIAALFVSMMFWMMMYVGAEYFTLTHRVDRPHPSPVFYRGGDR